MDAPKRLTQKGYRPRLIEERLDTLMRAFGCVRSTAPNGAARPGRRSLARRASPGSMSLRSVAAEVDPSLALIGDAPHLVDEWQEVPEVWDAARRFVDASGNERGTLLLTGSTALKARSAAMFVIPAWVGSPVCQCAPWPCVESGDGEPLVSLASLFKGEILPLSVARHGG